MQLSALTVHQDCTAHGFVVKKQATHLDLTNKLWLLGVMQQADEGKKHILTLLKISYFVVQGDHNLTTYEHLIGLPEAIEMSLVLD